MDQLVAFAPICGIFVGTLLLGLVAMEAGYRWARKRQGLREVEKEAPVGAMVGATLGLLAFLLAFTFGSAADAFHARKVAVMNEANAIRMAHLLSGVATGTHGSEIRKILREYVDQRLQWADGKQGADAAAAELLHRLWKQVAALEAKSPGDFDVFLTYAGRIIELQQERVMVREKSRIPGLYWAVLYLIAVLSLGGVGYHGGVAGTSRSPVVFAVVVAFSALIMVIADLDRPGQGFINVSQEPMLVLRQMLVAYDR